MHLVRAGGSVRAGQELSHRTAATPPTRLSRPERVRCARAAPTPSHIQTTTSRANRLAADLAASAANPAREASPPVRMAWRACAASSAPPCTSLARPTRCTRVFACENRESTVGRVRKSRVDCRSGSNIASRRLRRVRNTSLEDACTIFEDAWLDDACAIFEDAWLANSAFRHRRPCIWCGVAGWCARARSLAIAPRRRPRLA